LILIRVSRRLRYHRPVPTLHSEALEQAPATAAPAQAKASRASKKQKQKQKQKQTIKSMKCTHEPLLISMK
jgi:hypothetical protein